MSIEARMVESIGVIRCAGKLVRENQAALGGAVEELVSEGARGIALDFSGLEYIDSAGLGSCAGLHKKLRESGQAGLAVFGPGPNILRMWKMIRLDLVIPVLEDEEAVRNHFDTQTEPEIESAEA